MADIQHAIQIGAPPEAIYPLVSTAAGFAQWWARDVTEPDGAVELGFFNRSTVYRVGLRSQQPPMAAEWLCQTGEQWNGTRITFQLEARGGGTLLRFTHGDWGEQTDYFISCNTTWGALL
jgi:hypothetical protein